MREVSILHLFLTQVSLLLLPFAGYTQLYYASQEAPLQVLNAENATSTLGTDQMFLALLKSYQKLKSKEKIVVPDSVVIEFFTDGEGQIVSSKVLQGVLATHIESMEAAIRKQAFSASSKHKMVWVFPPILVDAYPIWEVENPPILKSCRKINKEANALYTISCFNYVARSRLLEIPKPSPKKEEELRGSFKATVTITSEGDVQMVAFDSLSTNPKMNDYFVYQLYTVKFPKGGTKNGKPVGYSIVFKDEYFLEEKKFEFQIEAPVTYEFAYTMINDSKNNETIREDSTMQTVLHPTLQALVRPLSTQPDICIANKKPIAGPVLYFLVNTNNYFPINKVDVFLPAYSPKKTSSTQVATFTVCDTSNSARNQSNCSAQWLLNYFYTSVRKSKIIDFASTASLQSILIDDTGKIERILVSGGERLASVDLEIMRVLSELPPFSPGTFNGVKHPTLYNIFVILP